MGQYQAAVVNLTDQHNVD